MSANNVKLHGIERSMYNTYRFEQIAQCISERVEPSETDLPVYIGLEHLDADTIHIKRSGKPQDVEGQKLRCYPGDVIFGKRRAYQRKAAICTEPAICSAHAFVLRANHEVIIPELLPFFLHSDQFMHRAVDISVGGLSPTINWSHLKKQEFLLPPKDQQAQIAELLWAMDEVVEQNTNTETSMNILLQSYSFELLSKSAYSSDSILSVAKVQRGRFSHRPRNEPKFFGGNVPFIQTGEVVAAEKFIHKYQQTLNEEGVAISKKFKKGTIVMTIAANIGYVGILPFEAALTDSLVGIQANEKKILQDYLFYFLAANREKIEGLSTESAQKNLSIEGFSNFEVLFPSDIQEQLAIVKKLDDLREVKIKATQKTIAARFLLKSLINEVF